MIESVSELVKNHPSLLRVSRNREKLIGRDLEVQLLRESLEKKRMKNSIIVGDAGVGKTAIIQELAYKIKDSYTILEFNLSSALAGTKYRGEFEEKIIGIIRDIVQFNSRGIRPVILFIDEIHTISIAGKGDNSIDAANILKPYLSRGDITIIGATTPNEYKKYIKPDTAISRRLSPVFIKPLDKEQVIDILRKFSENSVDDSILNQIYDFSSQLPGFSNPDISIEILDRCLARRKCTRKTIDEKMLKNIFSLLTNEL